MTRILVAEPVKLSREVAADLLGCYGYLVEQAASLEQAWDRIRGSRPDAVITAQTFEDGDGLGLCRRLKADPELRSVPFILLADTSEDDFVRQAVLAGCDDYLAKPLDDHDLVRKIEDLIAGNERRRFPRISTNLQVSFEDFKGIFFEFTRDISRSGVYIEMSDPLPIGTRLRLYFAVAAHPPGAVLAYGVVVRRDAAGSGRPCGVGVRFLHLDNQSREQLECLLKERDKPDPASKVPFGKLSLQIESGPAQRPSTEIARLASLELEQADLRTAVDTLQREHFVHATGLVIQRGLWEAHSPHEMLQVVRDALAQFLGATAFGVFLYDPQAEFLRPLTFRGLLRDQIVCTPIEGAIRRALLDKTLQRPPVGEVERAAHKALLVAPLVADDTAFGVISLNDLGRQKTELKDSDIFLFEWLSRETGRALAYWASRQISGEEFSPVTHLRRLVAEEANWPAT